MKIETITALVVAPLPVVRTFERFARELHEWWPREYTWRSGAVRCARRCP
jgi:hypothetical protein